MSLQAIKNSVPIKTKHAMTIANNIINTLHSKYNINSCTLGSLGKKDDEAESGDIDIAVECQFNDTTIKELTDIVTSLYNISETYISHGFKILSVGIIYTDNNVNKIVQTDLMFSNNLEYSKFMYHSPNFKLRESSFKGLYRTNLLTYIAGRKPTDIDDLIDENGNLTDYWKYTLTYDKGLMLTHKTYKGKKKLLKNPITVKEDTKLISYDINNIIKLILGDKATIKDTNSFESLLNYIFSDKYPYKSVLPNIISDFLEDSRHSDENVIKYIKNINK